MSPADIHLLRTFRGQARELIIEADGARVEADAADGSWQILDGQQRINARVTHDRAEYI